MHVCVYLCQCAEIIDYTADWRLFWRGYRYLFYEVFNQSEDQPEGVVMIAILV